jgi:hypothetical protein
MLAHFGRWQEITAGKTNILQQPAGQGISVDQQWLKLTERYNNYLFAKSRLLSCQCIYHEGSQLKSFFVMTRRLIGCIHSPT